MLNDLFVKIFFLIPVPQTLISVTHVIWEALLGVPQSWS